MLKKILLFLLLGASCAAYSQQLTRFAVVDLNRVYMQYFRDSRAVRDFEQRSGRIQAQVDNYTRQITALRSRHAEAVLRGDQAEANRLEVQINRESAALKDYYDTQTAILERDRAQLAQSDSFLREVNDEIRRIAESEGYSIVLNLRRDNNFIVWHSVTVDITDKVIQGLLERSGRN